MNTDYATKKLLEHRERWTRKKSLRMIYEEIFQQILDNCIAGPILEIGGGPGFFKAYHHDIVSTDIVEMPNLDIVCDAHRLPFISESFRNVVAIDVLHHVERPIRFLHQVVDVLPVGGRLIVVEPAITPVSHCIYALHEESVDMTVDPLEDGMLTSDRDPFEANQAIGTLIVEYFQKEHQDKVPNLRLLSRKWNGLLAYPLSGGFRTWSLLPYWLVMPLRRVENCLAPLLGRLCATRMLIVFEKYQR